MQTIKGYALLITGFLACPCHLPVTMPILLALTAGTALGAFLANNVWGIVALSTIYFVVALALGWRYISHEDQVCELPRPKTATRLKPRDRNVHIEEV